jgi:hypothetical protein
MKLLIKHIDKANHFIIGYLIAFLTLFFLNIKFCFIIVVLSALTKELWDGTQYKNRFDWVDVLYTILGSIPIFINQYI